MSLTCASGLPSTASLVDVLEARTQREPDAHVVTVLDDDGRVATRLTMSALTLRARAVAAQLQAAGLQGERVVVAHPPGAEYLLTLLGCFWAGAVPVPAYPPADTRQVPRLLALLADCRPAALLAPAGAGHALAALMAGAGAPPVTVLSPDTTGADAAADYRRPRLRAEDVALLQYTSGSTGDPRGVVLRHANVRANSAAIAERFGTGPGDVAVIWLPPYHDMGLTGGILHPLLAGYEQVSMSPVAFLRRPLTWLKAVQEHGGTVSGGPSFAFDLAVRRTSAQERADLDLSSWRVAFCGAEPVRASTARAFTEAFAPAGLPAGAFYPCYGMAESTLFVTGSDPGTPLRTLEVDDRRFGRGELAPPVEGSRRRTLVANGFPAHDHDVRVVDPATGHEVPAGDVGEIWTAGPSVSEGYFGRPDDGTFSASLPGSPARYLRTGDLGAITSDGLVVGGRIKDVMVVRGRNLYPDDVEDTVLGAHTSLAGRCAAAFSVPTGVDDGSVAVEGVVIVVETADAVPPAGDEAEALRVCVTEAVTVVHGVAPHAVVLLGRGGIPRTSSGKIRRRAARDRYLAATGSPATGPAAATAAGPAATGPAPTDRTLAVVRAAVVEVLGTDRAFGDDAPLAGLGMDSLRAVELRERLRRGTGVELDLGRVLAGASVVSLAEMVARGPAAPGEGRTREGAASAAGAAPTDRVTAGEAALWLLQRSDPGSSTYLLAHRLRLSGPVDVGHLADAVDVLAERHAALRTRFEVRDGVPRRRTDAPPARLVVRDVRGWSAGSVQEVVDDLRSTPMDLTSGPLWRWVLLVRGPVDHELVVVAHHVVSDLWSHAVLLDELGSVLAARAAGASSAEAAAALPAAGEPSVLAQDERRWLASPAGRTAAAHWERVLARAPEALDLPTDEPRGDRPAAVGSAVPLRCGASTARQVRSLADSLGVTPFSVLLAGFGWLLAAHAGGHDVAVGVPLANRARPEHQRTIGYRTNTVPVVLPADRSIGFADHVKQVHRQVVAALAHQGVPFPTMVRRARVTRPAGRNPVYDTMFALQDGPRWSSVDGLGGTGSATIRLGGAVAVPVDEPVTGAMVDLFCELADDGAGGWSGRLVHRTDLLHRDGVARIATRYERLLRQVVQLPQVTRAGLDLLGEDETRAVTRDWPAPPAPARRVAVPGVVRDRALADGRRLAVTDGGRQLTYDDLVARAGQVSRWLGRHGAGPERTVLVALPRGVDVPVAALGCWGAGACYVPVDPTHPTARLAALVDQVRPVAVVTSGAAATAVRRALAASRTSADAPVLDLGSCPDPGRAPAAVVAPDLDGAAYVMFTSGSTGRPKAVMVPHAGIGAMLGEFDRRAPLGPDDRCGWWTSPTFDVSVYEVFAALTVGACVHVVPDAVRTDAAALLRWSAEQVLTSCYLPPFLLPQVVELLEAGAARPPLRRVLIGVEPLTTELARRLQAQLPGAVLVNGYGPTEATVFSALHTVGAEGTRSGAGRLPIGAGVAGGPVYVLDEDLQPVPVGVPGEICIGGAGVARGYLDEPGRTAEVFVPDPLATPGARMYRTGDVGRWLPSGAIEFLGRRDQQVKVRGHRIEPGEVAHVLGEHPAVLDCRVLPQPGPDGETVLVAYLLDPSGTSSDTADRVLMHARDQLPRHLVPAAVVMVRHWPLTSSGKLDPGALPAVRWDERAAGDEPATPTERAVAAACAQVLGVPSLGAHTDFYAAGGHSLLAARAVAAISARLGRVVPVAWLLRHPTVHELARIIDATRPDDTGDGDGDDDGADDGGAESDDEPALVALPRTAGPARGAW